MIIGCKLSKVFKPPNPWVMGLMSALRELYDVPDLKLNIKFEIEVLCKAMKTKVFLTSSLIFNSINNIFMKVEDLSPSNIISSRKQPPKQGNPDFNIKALQQILLQSAGTFYK